MNIKKILLVLLGLGAVILLGLNMYKSSHFGVTKIIPGNKGTIATSTDTFEIRFNRELDASKDYKKDSIDDGGIIKSIKAEKKSLFITVKQLKEGTSYNFTIRNIYDKKGSFVSSLPFSFKATYISEANLTKEQRDLMAKNTDKGISIDPLLSQLPYGGINWVLTGDYESTESGTILVINAKITFSKSDVTTDKAAAFTTYKKQINDYITSLKLDPAKYNIRYQLIEPSIY